MSETNTKTRVDTKEAEPLEPEVMPREAPPKGALVPQDINSLAAQEKGRQILENRTFMLEQLRKASIRLTNPEDWVLYKDRRDAVVGYLQDCGCERIRDLYGIRIFRISDLERVVEGEKFSYLLTGDGECTLTHKQIERIVGGRSSDDDFCRDKSGLELDLAVRKAARANLDGSITRELAGLSSVPLQELEAAWEGTGKKSDRCRRGRGFGSQAERDGADIEQTEGVKQSDLPKCGNCGGPTKYVPGGISRKGKPYDAFIACEKRECKWTVDFLKWQSGQGAQKSPSAAPQATKSQPQSKASANPRTQREEAPPPTDQDIPHSAVTQKDIQWGPGNREE